MKYFDDVQVGDVMRFGRYEVTRDDPWLFIGKMQAYAEWWAGRGEGQHVRRAHRERLAHRGHVHPDGGRAHDPRARHLRGLGFDDLKWIRPVRPGDVLSVESEIREKIASRSRPDRGTVKIESRIMNQQGELVMSLVSLVIYLRR